jgi:streptomycin 3"-adenylyltransferase
MTVETQGGCRKQRYRCCMHSPTAHAVSFAQQLAMELGVILGDDLVGVYLHGSGATGGFNPDRSDIDLLVVSQQSLAAEQRRAVAELLLARSGAPYPVELTLLTTQQLQPWRHPTPFEFHFSERWRASLTQQLADGELSSRVLTDSDLAAHITVLRARGRVIVGAPIQEVFPEVPAADFRQVILADLDWIRANSTTIYGVLNACRILAYLDGQGLLSKAEGADWALENVPATYRATIAKARSAYRSGSREPCSPQEVQAFARWAAARAAQGAQRR